MSIHNSCTTGVEGALTDKPVTRLSQGALGRFTTSFLPHRVSVNADSFEELAGAIESVFAGNYRAPLKEDAAVRADVVRYIASLEGPSATERILSHISALPDYSSGRRHLTARLLDQGEQALRTIARTVLAPVRSTGGYAKQKFPGLAVCGKSRRLVERYRALTGRFGTVTVRHGTTDAVTIDAR